MWSKAVAVPCSGKRSGQPLQRNSHIPAVMCFASALVPGAALYAGLCDSLSDAQMVELASKKFVCIVDESKLVDGLGGSKGKSQTHQDAPSVQACFSRVARAC